MGADLLNGQLASTIAAAAGMQDASPSKFMVTLADEPEPDDNGAGFAVQFAKLLGVPPPPSVDPRTRP